MSRPETVAILGVPVLRATAPEALSLIEGLDGSGPALVAYANAHTLNLAAKDEDYRALLNRAAVVLNDGAGVGLAARLRRKPFPENLNGSDFNPRILELAAGLGWSVYFLGARPGVAERAAERMTSRIPGLTVAGVRNGYFSPSESGEVAAAIAASDADVVMVAMGNPLQEHWLDEHLAATGCRLGIGVGAFFDFSAGEVKRAPAWMNRWGIEWVYRLAQEPRRLFRRYVMGNPIFLARVLRESLRRR